MSAELHMDDGAALLPVEPGTDPAAGPGERRRPNVSGDLPTVLQAAPMFRRVVVGYDRFQVDTYVRWAEDELAAADREHEHLLARHLETRAELEEALELLSHSSGGGEFLQLSRRIGTMLAAAADEAERIRAEATAARAHAAGQATRSVARAEKVLADAEAEAARLVDEAAVRAEDMTTQARRVLDQAGRTGRDIRAEAQARLQRARVTEQRAAEEADRIRQRAVDEASAAREHARAEIVRMLDTARQQRRRSDVEAAAARERLDRAAAARSSELRAEVAALERRRAALVREVARVGRLVADPPTGRTEAHLHGLLDRLKWRSRSLRAP
jgi:cell division septum initiation protein DivIVA